MQQVHIKRYGKLNNCRAKDLMTWYLKRGTKRKNLSGILGIKETRFFAFIKQFRFN
jgi:hypothetical protein